MIMIMVLIGLIGFMAGFLVALAILPGDEDDHYEPLVADLANLRSDQIGNLIATGAPDQVLRIFEDRAKRILLR